MFILTQPSSRFYVWIVQQMKSSVGRETMSADLRNLEWATKITAKANKSNQLRTRAAHCMLKNHIIHGEQVKSIYAQHVSLTGTSPACSRTEGPWAASQT